MSVRLLENAFQRELEDLTGDRLLESMVALTIYPDPFQASATPKTQSIFTATASIKTYDPFSATAQLRGTQN